MPAQLHQGIDAPLAVAPRVVFDRLHEGPQRRAQRRAALGIQRTVEPHQAVLRFADVEVAAFVCAVGFGQRARGIDPMLEVLGDGHELARVHGLGSLQQIRFVFANGSYTDVLGRFGQDRHMLVADLATGQGRLRLWQLVELTRDLDAP